MYRENLQILPFYGSFEEQYHNRYRAFGKVAPLLAPNGFIPPFQVMVFGNDPLAFRIVPFGNPSANAGGDLFAAGLSVKQMQGFRLVVFTSSNRVNVASGLYYIVIENVITGNVILVSEVFNVMDCSDYVTLEWWEDEGAWFGEQYFDFSDGFRFRAFLETEFGKPQYFFEDTVRRRDGIDFAEKIISWKVYRCEVISGEPFLDGLRVARLHSFIELTKNGQTRKVNNFSFTTTWDEVGFFAVTTIDFELETIVKMTGKGRVI